MMVGERSLKPRVDSVEFGKGAPRVIPYGDFEFEAVSPEEPSKSKRVIPYGDFEFEAVSPEPQDSGDVYTPLQSFGRGFGSGVTLNWGDELLGAGSALTGGQYDETTQRLREEEDKARIDNPIWSLLGNVTGGVTLGALAQKGLKHLLPRVPYVGVLAPFLGAVIQKSPKLRNYIAAAAGAGAVSGAGQSQGDIMDRAMEGVVGGLGSGAVGAGLTTLGSGVRSLYRKVTPESASQKIASYIPEEKADDFFNKLKKDTPEDVADVLSHSEDLRQNLFFRAVNNEELNKSLRDIYTQAAQKARGEMKDDVTKILNAPLKEGKLDISESAADTMDAISKARKELADKEFGAIITDTLVDVSNDEKMKPLFEQFKEIVRTPYAQQAFKDAIDLLRSSGIKVGYYKPDGDTYVPSEMSMKILNEVRDQLKPDKWMHPKKLQTHEWAVRGQIQDEITDIMQKINPSHKEALKNFAEQSKKLDVIKEGAISFRYLTPEVSNIRLRDLNIKDDMMPYYKHGFASAFRDFVGNQKTLENVENLLNIQNVKTKIENVFGKEAYARIRESLEPKFRIEKNLKDLEGYTTEIKKSLWESMPKDVSVLGLLKRSAESAGRSMYKDFAPAARAAETQKYQDMIDILQSPGGQDLLDILLSGNRRRGWLDQFYRGTSAASPGVFDFMSPSPRSQGRRP